MTESLRETPLHAAHRSAGARLIGFGGWDMPVQYSGIGDEHQAVRKGAGRFDVSHMGRFYIGGPGAIQWLERLLPTRIGAMKRGQMAYSILCTPDGGAVDDLAVYRRGDDRFLLVVNASRAIEDLQTLQDQLPDDGSVTLIDHTVQEAMIAVQGPAAVSIVSGLAAISCHFSNLEELGFFRFRQPVDHGWLISRSGYTGEDGVEIICPAENAEELWQALRGAPGRLRSLRARALSFELVYSARMWVDSLRSNHTVEAVESLSGQGTGTGAPNREFLTCSRTFLEASSLENYHEFDALKYNCLSKGSTFDK